MHCRVNLFDNLRSYKTIWREEHRKVLDGADYLRLPLESVRDEIALAVINELNPRLVRWENCVEVANEDLAAVLAEISRRTALYALADGPLETLLESIGNPGEKGFFDDKHFVETRLQGNTRWLHEIREALARRAAQNIISTDYARDPRVPVERLIDEACAQLARELLQITPQAGGSIPGIRGVEIDVPKNLYDQVDPLAARLESHYCVNRALLGSTYRLTLIVEFALGTNAACNTRVYSYPLDGAEAEKW